MLGGWRKRKGCEIAQEDLDQILSVGDSDLCDNRMDQHPVTEEDLAWRK